MCRAMAQTMQTRNEQKPRTKKWKNPKWIITERTRIQMNNWNALKFGENCKCKNWNLCMERRGKRVNKLPVIYAQKLNRLHCFSLRLMEWIEKNYSYEKHTEKKNTRKTFSIIRIGLNEKAVQINEALTMAKYYNFWRIKLAVEYWWIPIQFVRCDQLIESWPFMRYLRMQCDKHVHRITYSLCHGRTHVYVRCLYVGTSTQINASPKLMRVLGVLAKNKFQIPNSGSMLMKCRHWWSLFLFLPFLSFWIA